MSEGTDRYGRLRLIQFLYVLAPVMSRSTHDWPICLWHSGHNDTKDKVRLASESWGKPVVSTHPLEQD